MDRDYKTGKSESVGVFSGLEIEHTPAYGLQTLFLARNDLVFDQIMDLIKQSEAEAVYFGANRKFMPNHATQITQMIKLLDKGYWVTIDYPHAIHDEVKKNFSLVWTHEKFIPFCSVIFPNSEEDTALCFKIDDVDFNKTNPGVWAMSMKDFKAKAGFTKWEQYKQDEPIEDKQIWPIPQIRNN
jgi:hypothetical protein